MWSCPACGEERERGTQVCPCGEDLSLLGEIDDLVDSWYRRAMEALRRGEAGAAVEMFGACAAARPNDRAVLVGLAQAWFGAGLRAPALRALDRAADLGPEDPQASELRRRLLEDPTAAPVGGDPQVGVPLGPVPRPEFSVFSSPSPLAQPSEAQ